MGEADFRYAILGSGRQGAAAAYDLARFGHASHILLADVREEVALEAAARVNGLVGRDVATATALDVADRAALTAGSRRCGPRT